MLIHADGGDNDRPVGAFTIAAAHLTDVQQRCLACNRLQEVPLKGMGDKADPGLPVALELLDVVRVQAAGPGPRVDLDFDAGIWSSGRAIHSRQPTIKRLFLREGDEPMMYVLNDALRTAIQTPSPILAIA